MRTKITYLYIAIFCFLGLNSGIFAQYQTKSLKWNTKAYDSLYYSGPEGSMSYRMLKPNNYNPASKYPLTLMFHGKGEGVGACDKPDCVLMWGGKMHLDSIDRYPGFVVFPDAPGGDWSESYLNIVKGIMLHIAQNYKIDPDRVYIHGLSAGGQGVWRMALANPQVFAAVSPMSASGDYTKAGNVLYSPIWTVQGELDTNPQPGVSRAMMNALQADGRHIVYTLDTSTKKQVWPSVHTTDPIYTLAPGYHHEAWPVLYDSPRWMGWMYAQKKNRIVVNGSTQIAHGESTMLGISPGFIAYQWSNGATTNSIKVTSPGVYRVRYKRHAQIFGGPVEWSAWSAPVVISRKGGLANTRLAGDTSASVTGFTLVNQDNRKDIAALHYGDHLDLAKLPTKNLSIRVDVDTAYALVRFELDGTYVHECKSLHASLFCDDQGRYNGGVLSEGKHQLIVTPYEVQGEEKIPGDPVAIEFTVINGSQNSVAEDVVLYPNPLQGRVYLKFAKPQKQVHMFMYNKNGRMIHQSLLSHDYEFDSGVVDISDLVLESGVYMIKIQSDSVKDKTFKVIKE